jgi:hypothetical protein
MRSYPKIWTVAMIGFVAFAMSVLFGPHGRDLTAHPRDPAPTLAAKAAAEPQYVPVAPADVLGTGTPFAPLTEEGSN